MESRLSLARQRLASISRSFVPSQFGIHPLEMVPSFEKTGGSFRLEHISEQMLLAQFEKPSSEPQIRHRRALLLAARVTTYRRSGHGARRHPISA